jgi:hypothetical protein
LLKPCQSSCPPQAWFNDETFEFSNDSTCKVLAKHRKNAGSRFDEDHASELRIDQTEISSPSEATQLTDGASRQVDFGRRPRTAKSACVRQRRTPEPRQLSSRRPGAISCLKEHLQVSA